MHKSLFILTSVFALLVSLTLTLQTVSANQPPRSMSWVCIDGGAKLSWSGYGSEDLADITFPGGSTRQNLIGSSSANFFKGDGTYSAVLLEATHAPRSEMVFLISSLGNPLVGIFANVLPIALAGEAGATITCSSSNQELPAPATPPTGDPVNKWETDNGIIRISLTDAVGGPMVAAQFPPPNKELYFSRYDEVTKTWVQVLYLPTGLMTSCTNNTICLDSIITISGHPSFGWRNVITRMANGDFRFEIYKPDGTLYAAFTILANRL